MSEQLPAYVEAAIREVEERLTAKLREMTGRADIEARVDRAPILDKIEGRDEAWPVPPPLPPNYWESAE